MPTQSSVFSIAPEGVWYPQFNAPSPLMFGPNITGTLNPVCQTYSATAPSGAFSSTTGGGMTGYEFARMEANFVFDASDSSSTYGSASTVQPASLRLILCIKI